MGFFFFFSSGCSRIVEKELPSVPPKVNRKNEVETTPDNLLEPICLVDLFALCLAIMSLEIQDVIFEKHTIICASSYY